MITKRGVYFTLMCIGYKWKRPNVYRKFRDLYRKEVGL